MYECMVFALEAKNIKKIYNGTIHALKGIDLHIESGDFFALLGPNGAGKTTFISILSGLTKKTDGSLFVGDVSIDDDPQGAKQHVGVVPQEFNFGIFEKVEDIVMTQAGYYGISPKDARPNTEKYLKKLGLWEKRGEMARTLSGGMKRRLMIARALVHSPSLLILDEPTAGVDLELRRDMYIFLKELNASGVTILLTTHYLEEAEELCRNLAIINKGEIVAQGGMKELLSQMDAMTVVCDVDRTLTEDEMKKLSIFTPVLNDREVSLTLTKKDTLSSAVGILNTMGVVVTSIKNKTNRLEEFFLQKTK